MNFIIIYSYLVILGYLEKYGTNVFVTKFQLILNYLKIILNFGENLMVLI